MPTPTEEKRTALEKHMSAARVHVAAAANYQWEILVAAAGTPEYESQARLSAKLTNLNIETKATLTALNTE
jgi:hypothetical protein